MPGVNENFGTGVVVVPTIVVSLVVVVVSDSVYAVSSASVSIPSDLAFDLVTLPGVLVSTSVVEIFKNV